MKAIKVFSLALALTAATAVSSVSAQTVQKAERKAEHTANKAGTAIKRGAKKTGNAVDKGAKAVGNKTAEVAVKGASKITDKTYSGKVAPDGSNVYIDGNKRLYYVNKKGAKIYVKEAQLRTSK